MVAKGVPSMRTPNLSRTPASASSTARLRPVWTAEGREHAVGAFLLDDTGYDVYGEGFDIDDVGDVLVGHDGSGVGVDEHGYDAFFAEGLTGLGAGRSRTRRAWPMTIGPEPMTRTFEGLGGMLTGLHCRLGQE